MADVICRHCGLEYNDQLLRCPKCDARSPKARQMDRVYGQVERQRRMIKSFKRLLLLAVIGAVTWYFWSTASDMAASRLGSAPAGPSAPEP